MEDVGTHSHTQSTSCGVTNTDRDECVLRNLSEAVRDVALSRNKCVSSLHCPPCILLRNTDIQAKHAEVKTAHSTFRELTAVPCK